MATAITWTLLPLGMVRECTTEGCTTNAHHEMDVGGVASNYCSTCKAKIEKKRETLHSGHAIMTLGCGGRAVTNGTTTIRVDDSK